LKVCVEGELKLLDGNADAIEPDRLMQISLGQENPRTWMNAAPGLLAQIMNPESVPQDCRAVVRCPFRANCALVAVTWGVAPG
jgi:hypothetical protein